MEKLLVLIGAALLIGFIIWWFFGKRDNKEMEATMSESGSRSNGKWWLHTKYRCAAARSACTGGV